MPMPKASPTCTACNDARRVKCSSEGGRFEYVGRHGTTNPVGRGRRRNDMGREIGYHLGERQAQHGTEGSPIEAARVHHASRRTAIGWPLAGSAQPVGRIPRIGFFDVRSELSAALIQGLRDAGYIEGQNMLGETRFYRAMLDRVGEFADELAAGKCDVTSSPPGRMRNQSDEHDSRHRNPGGGVGGPIPGAGGHGGGDGSGNMTASPKRNMPAK